MCDTQEEGLCCRSPTLLKTEVELVDYRSINVVGRKLFSLILCHKFYDGK